MRFAEFPGTSLDQRWRYVFAPLQMVEARRHGDPPPLTSVESRREVEGWLWENYPGPDWTFYGAILAISSEEIAFAFKMRWF